MPNVLFVDWFEETKPSFAFNFIRLFDLCQASYFILWILNLMFFLCWYAVISSSDSTWREWAREGMNECFNTVTHACPLLVHSWCFVFLHTGVLIFSSHFQASSLYSARSIICWTLLQLPRYLYWSSQKLITSKKKNFRKKNYNSNQF